MTVLCFFITNQIRGNTLRFSRIYISTGSGVTPESILHLWPNILIPYFLKLLIYSVSVWWKCGHYPSIRSHIVVPLGSIHPSKVYSWGQASVPCIINRTELSAALRIRLHLAGRYRSVLWKTATLWAQSQSYWEMTGCVFVNFSLNHREMTLDLTIWLSPPATHLTVESTSCEIPWNHVCFARRFIDSRVHVSAPLIGNIVCSWWWHGEH